MSASLTYFDFEGSRGLACRLALSIAGVPFTDIRLDRPQWAELKPSTPFGGLPLFSQNGRQIAQSTAILRYIGTTHGLHPTDAWRAAEHDAVMQSVEDLRHKMPGTRHMPEDEKRSAREEFAAGWLTRWSQTISDQLKGPFLDGDALHVADIKLYVILRACLTGVYDYIPSSFFGTWPKLEGLIDAMEEDPRVMAYFQSRSE